MSTNLTSAGLFGLHFLPFTDSSLRELFQLSLFLSLCQANTALPRRFLHDELIDQAWPLTAEASTHPCLF
jgi:hypothetical protein